MIEKRKCIVCEREYEYKTTPKQTSRRAKAYRGKNTLTCSKKCSRIYNRVAIHVHNNIRKKLK